MNNFLKNFKKSYLVVFTYKGADIGMVKIEAQDEDDLDAIIRGKKVATVENWDRYKVIQVDHANI